MHFHSIVEWSRNWRYLFLLILVFRRTTFQSHWNMDDPEKLKIHITKPEILWFLSHKSLIKKLAFVVIIAMHRQLLFGYGKRWPYFGNTSKALSSYWLLSTIGYFKKCLNDNMSRNNDLHFRNHFSIDLSNLVFLRVSHSMIKKNIKV